MSFHVGFDPGWLDVAVYNESNKEKINFKITKKPNYKIKLEDAEKIFKEIKTKIDFGKLGYACIYLLERDSNEIRKGFIEKGKECGFLNVQIINENMSLYLDCISQIKQRPKNDDIIWIYWYGNLYIWKKLNSKAKMVKEIGCETNEKLSEIMQKVKYDYGNEINPDIFIYDGYNANNLKNIKILYPKCRWFKANTTLNYSDAALIKARIMAKDKEVSDYDVESQIVDDLDLITNFDIVMSIKKYNSLPFEKALSMPDDNKKVFRIYAKGSLPEEIKISQTKEIYKSGKFLVKIDENRIIKIDTVMPSVNCLTRQLAIEYEKRETNNSESWIISNQNKNSDYFLTSFEKPNKITTNDNINIVGIDLGTTRCFVAVNRKNKVETIALDNSGERTLPSYVSFNDGKEMCGQLVVSQLQNYAKTTVFDSKRIIGKHFLEVVKNQTWPFEIINDNNKPMIIINNGNIKKAPEEITAVLLKQIKQKVEEFQGKELDEVVITIPADFNQNQKIATHVAAILAGWKTVHFLAEPIAASIAYFVDRPIPPNFNLLLFDLGGGTLDISIFKIEKDKLKIEAIHGDANLGGRDFDKLLFDYFKIIFKKENNIEIEENGPLKYRLMQKSMEIKHTLSTEIETSLDVSDFNCNADGYLKITRVEFEKFATPLLSRIQEVLKDTLSKTDYISSAINKVLLVGGGCRMPMIKSFLLNMFKKSEFCSDEHPDEIVAIGAAYYSSYLNLKKNEPNASYLKSQNNSNCSIM